VAHIHFLLAAITVALLSAVMRLSEFLVPPCFSVCPLSPLAEAHGAGRHPCPLRGLGSNSHTHKQRQAYQELAVALVKGNAMCGWRGMQLVMGGASGRAQLGAVPRGLRAAVSSRGCQHIPGAHLVAVVVHAWWHIW
jgi:hypothetical protein